MHLLIWAGGYVAVFAIVLHGLSVWGHDSNAPYAHWINSLMKPDVPLSSCCGVADQFYVKEYRSSQRKGIAFTAIVISHNGLSNFSIDVPEEKVIWNRPNPTGRGVIFIKDTELTSTDICFVPSLGL